MTSAAVDAPEGGSMIPLDTSVAIKDTLLVLGSDWAVPMSAMLNATPEIERTIIDKACIKLFECQIYNTRTLTILFLIHVSKMQRVFKSKNNLNYY